MHLSSSGSASSKGGLIERERALGLTEQLKPASKDITERWSDHVSGIFEPDDGAAAVLLGVVFEAARRGLALMACASRSSALVGGRRTGFSRKSSASPFGEKENMVLMISSWREVSTGSSGCRRHKTSVRELCPRRSTRKDL